MYTRPLAPLGTIVELAYAGEVAIPPLVLGGVPPVALDGVAFAFMPTLTGGSGIQRYFSYLGSLPDGVSLNPVTGALTGTPFGASFYQYTLFVTDNSGSASLGPFSGVPGVDEIAGLSGFDGDILLGFDGDIVLGVGQ